MTQDTYTIDVVLDKGNNDSVRIWKGAVQRVPSRGEIVGIELRGGEDKTELFMFQVTGIITWLTLPDTQIAGDFAQVTVYVEPKE